MRNRTEISRRRTKAGRAPAGGTNQPQEDTASKEALAAVVEMQERQTTALEDLGTKLDTIADNTAPLAEARASKEI